MKTLLLLILFFSSNSIYSQTDSVSYIQLIERYINTYEQDSLEADIYSLELDGYYTKKKFKFFNKTIGGFSDYLGYNEKNKILFNFKHGERYFNIKKYPNVFYDSYYKEGNLIKYYKETESKKYTYITTAYFNKNELISLETNDPNFTVNEIYNHDKAVKKYFEEHLIAQEKRYK